MRILISLVELGVGGSQINAIEIGGRLARAGHEVLVYGPDGVLRSRLADLGLEYVPAGAARRRHPPTWASVRAVTALARERAIDLVHAYEWAPTLEAAYGPFLRLGVPVLSTVYSVRTSPMSPKRVTTIRGFDGEAELDRRRGWRRLHVVNCPVDTDANAPVEDAGPARRSLGIADDELAVVLVSRLARELKLEGILSAVRATALVPPELRMRLVIVGDGPCRPQIEQAAGEVNARLGRRAVTLTGELLDPRPGYAAADIVLSMGSSAVKGMAFAKPVIVQGERGFWELCTPQTLPRFLRGNFYGLGDGGDGAPRLASMVTDLVARRDDWPRLGEFGRGTAVSLFSNDVAASRVMGICEEVVAQTRTVSQRLAQVMMPTVWLAGYRAYELARRTLRR